MGGSAKKVGLRIKELERLYGIEYGNNRFKTTNNSESITQENLASQMNISVDTLQNYKLLADIIPELEELLDTGIVTKTTALAIMKNLSPIQRIAVTEKYRPIYERQARESQGTRNDLLINNIRSNLTESNINYKKSENETNSKLAKIAGVKPTTYKMGAKVINSDNVGWYFDYYSKIKM